ncbi:MAG TPA: M67 family metallopeptidase [Thermodesulfovibrionales bacterium]|jgi:proteasome lid subunit RPN8/RPN11|nr:M67 family metallopeptidase [Thermodesulfovibrionales bacterium]
MSEIRVPARIFDEMIAHCRRGYPNESCGILAGKGNKVSALYPMTNIENSPVSYLMDPSEQFKAMKDMREKDLAMVAIFHSHPASAPFPSNKDVSLAYYDDCDYVIVSLAEDMAVVKGFLIKEARVEEVAIVIED